jgi:hypothetical protein
VRHVQLITAVSASDAKNARFAGARYYSSPAADWTRQPGVYWSPTHSNLRTGWHKVADVPSQAERAFHGDMVAGADRLRREIGYNPTRFNQMVAEHGGPEAVRRLLQTHDVSDGFATLWENGRLEMSCEAHVLLPWYRDLFTNEQVAIARRRLIAHHFDVDAFLDRAVASPPSWWG